MEREYLFALLSHLPPAAIKRVERLSSRNGGKIKEGDLTQWWLDEKEYRRNG